MASEQEQTTAEQQRRGDRWLLWLIFALFIAGMALRGYAYVKPSAAPVTMQSQPAAPGAPQKAFPERAKGRQMPHVPLQDVQSTPQDQLLFQLAPYLTEGGLSFFLGFCLGYFLRVVAKTAMFVVGGLYVTLILLSHYGMIQVDWGIFQHLLRELLLNTQTHLEGLQGVLKTSLPSVAMAALGMWRGFKKP